jgi:hypothetical protein
MRRHNRQFPPIDKFEELSSHRDEIAINEPFRHVGDAKDHRDRTPEDLLPPSQPKPIRRFCRHLFADSFPVMYTKIL